MPLDLDAEIAAKREYAWQAIETCEEELCEICRLAHASMSDFSPRQLKLIEATVETVLGEISLRQANRS